MKKENIKVLLISILSILVLGLASYIIYNETIKDNEEKDGAYIEIGEAQFYTILNETISDFQDVIPYYLTLDVGEKIIISELDTEDLIKVSARLINIDEFFYRENENNRTYITSSETMKNALLSIGYIKDEKVLDNLKDIDLETAQFKYNAEDETYIYYVKNLVKSFIHYNDYKFEQDKENFNYYVYRNVYYKNYMPEEETKNYGNYKFTFDAEKLYSVERIK